jgi:hypothetical protein
MKASSFLFAPILLFVVTSVALGQKNAPSRAHGEPVPIFALLGTDRGDSFTIDPMLLIDGQTIRAVPDPCTETSALRDFNSQYLKPGTVYPVVFGGVQQGTVTVRKPQATDWGWPVEMNSHVRTQGLTMALAVGSLLISDEKGSRRDPTVAEQNHVKKLSREILISEGVPAASLTRMRLDQVVAMQLNHSMKLIASVEVERLDKMGMEYSLFFVADPDSDRKSTIWLQRVKGETDAEAVYLIDHLDVAKDGTDRMFVRRVFYENYKYEVYKNSDGRWVKEFASEVFGCL